MQYNEEGHRVFARFSDEVGQAVVVEETHNPGHVWVQHGTSSFKRGRMRLSRDGAQRLIDGLTAFMANTDGVPDLPEPDVGRR